MFVLSLVKFLKINLFVRYDHDCKKPEAGDIFFVYIITRL